MWLCPTGWHLPQQPQQQHKGKQRWPARSTGQLEEVEGVWAEEEAGMVWRGVCKVYSHENMKALATNCLTSAAIESAAAASNAQLAMRRCSQLAACSVQRGARFKRMQITIVEHKWCRNKHECRCKSVDKRGKRRLLLQQLLNP